jgi:hypothetical protein
VPAPDTKFFRVRTIMGTHTDDRGLEWPIGVWDRTSQMYLREIDRRFALVVERRLVRAALERGERVVDRGIGG